MAMLGATLVGVAGVTLLLIGVISPHATAEPTPSAAPSFDLAIAPDRIGGRLAVTGDRSGTLLIERVQGGVQSAAAEGDSVSVQRGPFRLIGENGQVMFGGDPEDGVTQIDFDDLSFYLDPGDCDITLGERNDANGLMAVRLDCPELADLRGGGIVSVEGVVAVPGDVLGERGDVPPSGGSVTVGDETVELSELIMVGGGELVETGRVPLSVHGADPDTVLGLEYDPDTAEIFLTYMIAGGIPLTLPEPCPVMVEDLGDLSDFTSVVRLTIDCDALLEDGTSTSLDGTVVVDSDVELRTVDP